LIERELDEIHRVRDGLEPARARDLVLVLEPSDVEAPGFAAGRLAHLEGGWRSAGRWRLCAAHVARCGVAVVVQAVVADLDRPTRRRRLCGARTTHVARRRVAVVVLAIATHLRPGADRGWLDVTNTRAAIGRAVAVVVEAVGAHLGHGQPGRGMYRAVERHAVGWVQDPVAVAIRFVDVARRGGRRLGIGVSPQIRGGLGTRREDRGAGNGQEGQETTKQ